MEQTQKSFNEGEFPKILTERFKEIEVTLNNQIRMAKVEIGYSLLVPDKEKKKIQKLAEKTRTDYGKEALKKSNGDPRKAISLLCSS